MPEPTIPSKYRSGLITIAQMTDEDIATFAEVLRTEHPALLDRDLVKLVTNNVRGIAKGDTANAVEALLWLAAGHSILAVPIEELAQDISQASDLELTEVERELLASRITKLVSTKTIGITSKALDVLTEHDRTFYDARIMTDIRPIFGDVATETPAAAVITHTLKIHYHHGTNHNEFFVVLDNKDIRLLRQVIERAEKKAATLRTFIEGTEITYLDPEGNTDAK